MFRILQILSYTLLLLLGSNTAWADEGLWLPFLLREQKFAEMRRQGLRLQPEEIYSVNRACAKDGVVGLFHATTSPRSFSTAFFISKEGLLLTSYSGVLSSVKSLSISGEDLLQNGFRALEHQAEKSCTDLSAKQLIRMEDVTTEILSGTETLTGRERSNRINQNGEQISAQATRNTPYKAEIQSLFGGTQFLLNLYVVYPDVRLVVAPSSRVANFGGPKMAYTWPRYAADFVVLRVYAGPDNSPAPYAATNRPYHPTYSFPLSLRGYTENEFAWVFGFPGSTRTYIPALALQKICDQDHTARIAFREAKNNVLKKLCAEDSMLQQSYSAQLTRNHNVLLELQGERFGVTRQGLIARKQAEEKIFQQWAESDPDRQLRYGKVLPQLDSLYRILTRYNLADLCFFETALTGANLVPFIGKFEKLIVIGTYNRKSAPQDAAAEVRRLNPICDSFFATWNPKADAALFAATLKVYLERVAPEFYPAIVTSLCQTYGNNFEKLTESLFARSVFTHPDTLKRLLQTPLEAFPILQADTLYQLALGYYLVNAERIVRQRGSLQAQQGDLYRHYLEGYRTMKGITPLFPDANTSLRYSFGKIRGCGTEGLLHSKHTTWEGLLQKSQINPDVLEFQFPFRREHPDFGCYTTKEGTLPLNFLAEIHTSGGSSGSPVLNAKGEVLGLNFDRLWQGIASDYGYDPTASRLIAVDIRYILWFLEYEAEMGFLLEELTLNR